MGISSKTNNARTARVAVPLDGMLDDVSIMAAVAAS